LATDAAAVQAAAANYHPKDVLVLHSFRHCSQADDGCAGSDASTSISSSGQHGSKGGARGARYLEGTFGHHLTAKCWEAEPSTLKL
jgi:hypothetical protein